MDVSAAKKKASKFVAELDHQELAVRLIEIGCHMKRRPGTSSAQAWQDIQNSDAPQYIKDDFEKMALAAIAYFSEVVSEMKQTN